MSITFHKVMIDNTTLFRARVTLLGEKRPSDAVSQQRSSKASSPVASASFLAFPATARHKQQQGIQSSQNFGLYSTNAREILADVVELRNLVLDKRKEYVLCSNTFSLYGSQSNFMSDDDRKAFDRETDLAIRQISKLIKEFEKQINTDKSLRPDDEFKHLKMIVYLLNRNLKEVCNTIAHLRAIHLRKSQYIRKIARLANLVDMYETSISAMQEKENETLVKVSNDLEASRRQRVLASASLSRQQQQDEQRKTDGWDELAEEDDLFLDSSMKEDLPKQPKIIVQQKRTADVFDEVKAEPDAEELSRSEQLQLVAENRDLFERMVHTNSEIDRIETQLSEIQRLQNTFTEKIVEQEHDIESIHTQTIHTLDNLETANDFIRQAIKSQANRRVIALFCLIVLTFTLLFLDWYNS